MASACRLVRLEELAGRVSRETYQCLLVFETRLRKWSERINLVAPSALDDLWERHIFDSAQLAGIDDKSKRWVDLGSGGGFPGAIVAILLRDRPGSRMDLIESNGKKAAFLRSVLGEVGAPAHVHAARIEDTYPLIRDPQVVTARALAPLPVLLGMAEPWLRQGGKALFHKGRGYLREIEQCADAWQFDLIEHRSQTDPDGVILEIANVVRRGTR